MFNILIIYCLVWLRHIDSSFSFLKKNKTWKIYSIVGLKYSATVNLRSLYSCHLYDAPSWPPGMVRHLFNVRQILMYHDAPCVPNYDGHLLYNDCTVSQLCDAPFLDFDEPWLSEWRTSVKTRQLNFPTSQSNKSMQTWKSIASSLTVTRSFSFSSLINGHIGRLVPY